MVARGVGRVLDGEWIATDLGDRCKPFDVFPVVECTRSVDGQPLRFNSLAERVMNEISYVADVPGATLNPRGWLVPGGR